MSNFASPAKPISIGGGIYVGDVGTSLPTSTADTLNQGFTALGYISTDGVTRSRSDTTSAQKVWGGSVVGMGEEGYEESIKFKVVDLASIKALELAYGEATGTFADGITAKSKAGPRPTKSYVVDMVLKDNAKMRLVIPCGVVSAVGDRVYKDNELVGVELTVLCMADSNGNTVYEYTKQAAAAAAATPASGGSETGSAESGSSGGGG